jgi:hypothetical protein
MVPYGRFDPRPEGGKFLSCNFRIIRGLIGEGLIYGKSSIVLVHLLWFAVNGDTLRGERTEAAFYQSTGCFWGLTADRVRPTEVHRRVPANTEENRPGSSVGNTPGLQDWRQQLKTGEKAVTPTTGLMTFAKRVPKDAFPTSPRHRGKALPSAGLTGRKRLARRMTPVRSITFPVPL